MQPSFNSNNSKCSLIPHISLRWVLIIPSVVQIVGAVGLVGYLSYRSGEKAVEEMMGHLTTETGDRIEAHLDSYLQAPQKVNQLNLKVLESGIIDPKDFESLGKYFWQELQSYDFTYINYGNQQNEFIGSGYVEGKLGIAEVKKPKIGTLYRYQVDHQGDRLNPPEILKGENPNNAAWYSQAIAVGKPIWSPIYNWADIPDEVAISASAPVYDQSHQLLGVVGIDLSLSKISAFLQSLKIGKSGKVFIVERSGLLVANSTTQKPYKLVNGQAQRLEAKDIQDPLIKSTLQIIQEQFGDFKQIKNNQKHPSRIQILDQKNLIQVIPYQDNYGIDWFIVVTSPKSDFLAEVDTNNHHTILLCLLTLGIATGAGILSARWITNTIQQIGHASQSLAKGEDHGLLLTKSRITELEALADSFNQMAQQVKISFNQVEITLQKSTEKYRILFQNLPIGIAITDPQGKIIEANPASEKISGISIEKQVNLTHDDPIWRIVNHDGLPMPIEASPGVIALQENRPIYDVEMGVVRTDENIRWISVSAVPMTLEQYGVAIACVDITERKNNELKRQQTLLQSESRYRQVVQQQTDFILRSEADTTITFANEALCFALGYALEEVVGRKWIDFADPNDLESILHKISALKLEEPNFRAENRDKRADGTIGWTQWINHGIFDEQGNLLEIQSVGRDITELKQIELENQRLKERLEFVISSIPAIIYTCKAEGDYGATFISKEFMGYTPEEFLADSSFWASHIHPEDAPEIFAHLSQLFDHDYLVHEYRFQHKNGAYYWLRDELNLVRDSAGQPIEIIGSFFDISDRKTAELALKKSETRFQKIAASSPAAIYILVHHTNGSRSFEYVSSVIEDICEFTSQQLQENFNLYLEQIHPDDRLSYQKAVANRMKNLSNFQHEWRIMTPSKKVKWIKSISRPECREHGDIAWYGIILDISDRKKAEELLRQNEQKYQQILDSITDIVLVKEPDFHIAWANKAFRDYYGMTLQKLQGIIDAPFNEPDYTQQYIKDDAFVFNTGQTLNISEELVTRYDGNVRPFSTIKSPIFNNIGQVIMLVAVCRDITDRKEAEIALQNSEAQYRHLIENLAAGVVVHDHDSSIVSCNAIACEILGLSFAQLCGKTMIDPALHFFTKDHQIMAIEDYPVNRVLKTGQPIKDYVVGINHPHNQSIAWVLVNAFPNFDPDGQIKDVVVTFLDITSLKQAEAQYQKLFQRLTVALESGAIGCWEWDLNSNVIFWDDRMYELYGIVKQFDTIAYDIWAKSVHPDDRLVTETLLQKVALGDAEYETEFRVVHPDGSIHFIQAYGVVVKDDQEKPQSLIGVNFDISDRKQTEKALAQAKEVAEAATKAKSEFLANMSHEIRTPMNGVLGMAQLLTHTQLTEEQKDIVQTIQDSGDALLVVINDILDFSKIESGMLQLEEHNFNLSSLIKSVCTLLQSQAVNKDIQLTHVIAPNVPKNLLGDPSRLRQILLNLMGNALKFTDSGSISISVTNNQLSIIREDNNEQKVELMIAIRDTGIGISDDRLQKLFKPFSQADASISRKYGGTGLGLAISKSLVNLMGGTIWVESLNNFGGDPPENWDLEVSKTHIQGSIFYFTFQAKEVSVDDLMPKDISSKSEVIQTIDKSALKILLAEDNKVNQKVALFTLKKLGYNAEIANNGLEVLALLKQKFYDVILMDMQMPEMDGVTATKMIRQSGQPQPYIIALTANALDEDRQLCLNAGMNDYLRKPIVIAELTEALNKYSHY